MPGHHAWCLDADGRVVDPTWPEPGVIYFGVPFAHDYILQRWEAQILRDQFMGSLLDLGDDDYALVKGTETRPWKPIL